MKAFYFAAWLMICGFLAWSGNLLLNIQENWAQSNQLHGLRNGLDSLAMAWRDLSRPGNDVLENYEVELQRAAFRRYARRYDQARQMLAARAGVDPSIGNLLVSLEVERDNLQSFASGVLSLAEQREGLRRTGAPAAEISAKETEAGIRMARMDQAFQSGLDLLLSANEIVVARELGLEGKQRRNFQRLYVMLLVALIASALSVELLRRTFRQREAIRDGAARINAIVNHAADGIVTVDERGRIRSFNPSAEAMFGYSAQEMVGQEFTLLLDEGCRAEYHKRLRLTPDCFIPSLHSAECEELGRRKDGSAFPLELAVSQVLIEGRRTVIHMVRDITERKRAESELRLAASVYESASEGIMITDAAGTIQSVNHAFCVITQYSREEAIGNNPRMLQSGRQDRAFYDRMWSALRESGHWQGEIWNRRKNGEVYPQWLTISAIRDSRGRTTNYVGVTWDITELKQSELAKQEFIATVSHELRTPLTSVLGSLGLLVGGVGGPIPEQARRLLEMAHSNSERLVRLISDILDIEKMEAGKMRFQLQPLELMPLVEQAIESNRALADQHGVGIEIEQALPGARVVGDTDRLIQVLTNLLSNAAKFSPAGDKILVGVAREGSMLRVSVTDHGPGIPPEFRPDVFKKFAQADSSDTRRRGGSGLGLSISKVIVEKHGGRIDFDSEPGVRTTFRFDLPEFQRGSGWLTPEGRSQRVTNGRAVV